MSSGTQYFVSPMQPGVRPKDDPDYDGITFVYVTTNVLVPWTQPPVNGNVGLSVVNSQGFVPGMTIVIGDGNGGSAGYYQVVSTPTVGQMVVMNFGTDYNQPPGTGFGPDKVTTTSLPGPPGGIGPQGPVGPLGPPGPPLNPKGTVATSSALPASGNAESDLWITSDTGHGWAWNGANWIDTGPYQGPPGAQGAQGVQGVQGAQGNQGVSGPQGNQGPSGATGSQGVQGPQGTPGTAGATGPPGPPGGASAFTTLSAVFTMPAVNSTAVANVASGGAAQFSVGGIVYISPIGYLAITAVNSGANQLTLQNLGYGVNQAPGSTAPSGNTLTGTGPAGATGSTGPAGAAGPAGSAATIAPGTTSTGAPGTNANVTNAGTPSAAVFNFTIPAGQTGAVGAQGPQGTPGATGATGSQGPAGATGSQGPSGAAGINAYTITSAQFTVPPVGGTVVVTFQNASWLVLGQYVEVKTAGGVSLSGTLQVTNISGNQVTLLNPSIPSLALANNTAAGLLAQVSGNISDYVGGDNACHPLVIPAGPAGFVNQNTAYTVVAGDIGKYFICTGGSWTLTLPAPTNGFFVRVRNDQGISGTTGTITLTPPSGTIDGLTSQFLLPGQECTIISDGANWRTLGRSRSVIIGAIDISSAVATQLVLLPSGYRLFDIDLYGFMPVTDAASLQMKLSGDGGSTFIASYWDSTIFDNAATTVGFSAAAPGTYMRISSGMRNANHSGQISMRLFPSDGTKPASWLGEAEGYATTNGRITRWAFAGQDFSLTLVNAMQIIFSSGNIAIGSIVVRGIV